MTHRPGEGQSNSTQGDNPFSSIQVFGDHRSGQCESRYPVAAAHYEWGKNQQSSEIDGKSFYMPVSSQYEGSP